MRRVLRARLGACLARQSMKSRHLSSPVEDRVMDFLIAASLAILPLLPAGPAYLGLDWRWALEAFFWAVVAAGLAVAVIRRLRVGIAGSRQSESVRLVRRGYVTWLIPVAAATLIGVLERNPLDLVLFSVETDALVSRLTGPMHHVADPLYPLRIGLTCFEGGLAFWLLSAILPRSGHAARRLRLAITGCLMGVGLVSGIAIVQYITRANLLAYWVRANPDLTRAHATLDDPNALASFLVLSLGLAAGVAWSSWRGWADWRRQLGALVVIVLACAALVTTVSRAGLLALVIAAIVCAASLPEPLLASVPRARMVRLITRGVAALLIGAVLLWAAALAVMPERTDSLSPATPWEALVQTVDPRESLDRILKGRLLLWQAALQFASDNWTLGAGLGQFPRLYSSYPGSAGGENAHNYFLQVLAEGGLVGLAGLCVLLVTIGLAIRPPGREGGASRGRLAFGLSVGLLAFVLTWLTGHPLLTLSNQLWLACVLALGLAALESPVPDAGAIQAAARKD